MFFNLSLADEIDSTTEFLLFLSFIAPALPISSANLLVISEIILLGGIYIETTLVPPGL